MHYFNHRAFFLIARQGDGGGWLCGDIIMKNVDTTVRELVHASCIKCQETTSCFSVEHNIRQIN